jgi:hypothetical protein
VKVIANTRLLYRISAIMLLLFAAGHQMGFRRGDPKWNAATVVTAMQGTHFAVNGFDRSYWDFFSGFGFFVTVLLLFSAVLCWALSNATAQLRNMMIVPWALAISYTFIAIMTWEYFFIAPGMFASVVALMLILAALATRRTPESARAN